MHLTYVALHEVHGAWLYGAQRTRRDGSSFMWHQPCQRRKYTTWADIQTRATKGYGYTFTHVESHASALRRTSDFAMASKLTIRHGKNGTQKQKTT